MSGEQDGSCGNDSEIFFWFVILSEAKDPGEFSYQQELSGFPAGKTQAALVLRDVVVILRCALRFAQGKLQDDGLDVFS